MAISSILVKISELFVLLSKQHYCVWHLYVNGNYLFSIYYVEKHHVEM